MNKEEMISEKQCFYLITFELFGLLTLFLPSFLSRKLSQDAPVGLTIGFLFAAIFALLLSMFYRKYQNEFLSAKKKNSFLTDVLIFLFFIQTILLSIFALNITWEIVQMFLLPTLNRFLILIPFFAVSVFALEKGLVPRAKMAEFCGKIFIFVLGFIFIFSLKKIDLNQYEAIFISSPKRIAIGSYDVFIILETLIFSLFAVKFSKSKDKYGSTLRKSIIACYILTVLLLLVLMGTFGVDYIGQMEYPAIRLLRNLTKSSSFLSRLDVLMIWIWLVSLFYFFCGSMNYAHLLLKSVLEESSGKYMNYVLYVVIFALAWIFGNVSNSFYIYRNYMFYIGTPFTVVALLLAIVLPKKEKENELESVGPKSEE